MRVLLIIFDGLADRPAPELDGKTPLEAARTPNLDRLAAAGINGLSFPYVYAGNGDGNLFMTGGASSQITDTDPLGLDLPVLRSQARAEASDRQTAARSADALNHYLTWAHSQLGATSESGDAPPI